MNLLEAQNEFALRLFKWSLRDLLRELEADCPLLSLVCQNNRRIGGFVSWNKILTAGERLRLATALVQSAHTCIQPTAEENGQDVVYWTNAFYHNTTLYMDRLPPHLPANRDLPTFHPIEPDTCLDDLVGSLQSDRVGKPVRTRSGVRCMHRIGDWKLITEFTFERRRKKLHCAHQFTRKDDPSRRPTPEIAPRPFPRSLFAFYGIYNRTVVSVEAQADSESMAEAMVKLAEHFVAQAGPLFAGLGTDD
ncbi:MAG TPA: hypothetical protein VFC07_00095 [Verrucomicrobiae bacterium]|nr:hypothetical protein [Verrucomicrobiae bacterium]